MGLLVGKRAGWKCSRSLAAVVFIHASAPKRGLPGAWLGAFMPDVLGGR